MFYHEAVLHGFFLNDLENSKKTGINLMIRNSILLFILNLHYDG
jgi:hypothetical protein